MNAFLQAGLIVMSVVVARWWWLDYRATIADGSTAGRLPGATRAPVRAIILAVAGALLLLAAETAGEIVLGLSASQSRMTVLAGFYSLAAAFIEELVFRGYLVITGRGRTVLVIGAVAASVLFALLHPFLWDWKDGRMLVDFSAKAWFSTAAIFAGSLWFYFVRFMPANPERSLLPCVAAHAAKNLGVFAVKLSQGFVDGWR